MPPARTPTDNFLDFVPRRKGQACHYAAHCPPSTCLREVVSVLALLSKNNEFGFIYASVAGITKMCNGRYRKGGKRPYKQRAVEKAIRILVVRKILSKKFAMEVNGFQRTGRILNAHDAMTKRYPQACHFIGAGKTPGTWTPDGKHFADPQTASEFGVVIEAARAVASAGSRAVASAGSRAVASAGASADQTEKLDGFLCGDGGGSKSLEPEEIITVPELPHGALAANTQTETPCNPVSSVSPLKKQTANNPATPEPNSKGNGKGQSTATAIATTELTDLTKDAAMVFKVKDHFLAERVSSARELLALLTDGELEYENPTMHAYENTKGNGDFQYEQLERCCRDVLADNSDKPLPDRKALADLMHECAALLKTRHKRNVPKCWYYIIGKLRTGPQALREREGAPKTFGSGDALRHYCNPYTHTWLHAVFHNAVKELEIQLELWERFFINFEPKDDARYADGWKWIEALLWHLKNDLNEVEPPELVAVRNWLWEADATHAKAEAPPWQLEKEQQ